MDANLWVGVLSLACHSCVCLAASELQAERVADRDCACILNDDPICSGDDAVASLQHRVRVEVQQASIYGNEPPCQPGEVLASRLPPSTMNLVDRSALTRCGSKQTGEVPPRRM